MGSTLSQALQRVSRTDPEHSVGQAGMPRQIVAPSTKNQRLTVCARVSAECRHMDAAELDRIVAALKDAIAKARVLAATDLAIGPGVRGVIRHARAMHDLFVEALIANEPLATVQYRGIAGATGNAIGELEALVARADGKIN